jgi:diguanylate cyclase (GGDEF)-like protein
MVRRDAATFLFCGLGLGMLGLTAALWPGALSALALVFLALYAGLPVPLGRAGWGLALGAALLGGLLLQGGASLGFAAAWVAALLLVHGFRRQSLATLARLEQLSHRDALTGAFNRHYLEVLRQPGPPGVVAYLDIDGLKELNRARGQGAGDEALQRLARGLASATVIRMGGDEFAVAFREGDRQQLEAQLAAVLHTLRTGTPALSFCAGLAKHNGLLAQGLQAADDALRRAKAQGAGSFCWAEGP